jgi:outer membrane protein assembly factor BamB
MVWKYSTRAYLSSSLCVAANNVVYFGSYNGNVLGLDASTGALLWSFPTGAYVVSSPAIGSDGTLYIGSGNGVLFALAGVLKCPCVSSTPSLPRALASPLSCPGVVECGWLAG